MPSEAPTARLHEAKPNERREEWPVPARARRVQSVAAIGLEICRMVAAVRPAYMGMGTHYLEMASCGARQELETLQHEQAGSGPSEDVAQRTGALEPREYPVVMHKLPDGAVPSRLCLLYTSPSPRDATLSRMPSSA